MKLAVSYGQQHPDAKGLMDRVRAVFAEGSALGKTDQRVRRLMSGRE